MPLHPDTWSKCLLPDTITGVREARAHARNLSSYGIDGVGSRSPRPHRKSYIRCSDWCTPCPRGASAARSRGDRARTGSVSPRRFPSPRHPARPGSPARWGAVFPDLVERGLTGVRFVVSDEHVGLTTALTRYFPDAAHQRCQVHYLRNALSYLSSDAMQNDVRVGLKDAWSAPTQAEAEARLTRLVDSLRSRAPKLASWLEETAQATLACSLLDQPDHRHRLRTTNSIEHDHAEVRRRTRVVRNFPNEASLTRLTTALAMERNDQWLERYCLTMPEPETEPLRQTA